MPVRRGFLGTHVFGFGDISGFDVRSIAIAVGGAILVLLLYWLLSCEQVWSVCLS